MVSRELGSRRVAAEPAAVTPATHHGGGRKKDGREHASLTVGAAQCHEDKKTRVILRSRKATKNLMRSFVVASLHSG